MVHQWRQSREEETETGNQICSRKFANRRKSRISRWDAFLIVIFTGNSNKTRILTVAFAPGETQFWVNSTESNGAHNEIACIFHPFKFSQEMKPVKLNSSNGYVNNCDSLQTIGHNTLSFRWREPSRSDGAVKTTYTIQINKCFRVINANNYTL